MQWKKDKTHWCKIQLDSRIVRTNGYCNDLPAIWRYDFRYFDKIFKSSSIYPFEEENNGKSCFEIIPFFKIGIWKVVNLKSTCSFLIWLQIFHGILVDSSKKINPMVIISYLIGMDRMLFYFLSSNSNLESYCYPNDDKSDYFLPILKAIITLRKIR